MMSDAAIKLVARWAREQLPEFQKEFPGDDRVLKAIECAENYKKFSRREIHEIADGAIIAATYCMPHMVKAAFAARLAREAVMMLLIDKPYRNVSHTVRYASEVFENAKEVQEHLKIQMKEAEVTYSDRW